jgi:hypothetical protein
VSGLVLTGASAIAAHPSLVDPSTLGRSRLGGQRSACDPRCGRIGHGSSHKVWSMKAMAVFAVMQWANCVQESKLEISRRNPDPTRLGMAFVPGG